MEKGLALALRHSRSLQYLSMYDCCIDRDLSEWLRQSGLKVVAENPRLRAILCRGEDPKEIKEKYLGHVANLIVHDSGK